MPLVLGIETSCDETSLSLIKDSKVLNTRTFSQIDLLEKWGGVVPEISSRSHLEKLPLIYKEVFEGTDQSIEDVDLIGVTVLPGLLGPLLMGLNFAKSISLYHKIPIYPVNHLFAHLEAIHLNEKVNYPYLGVILSGGHSLFTLVNSSSDIEILASTIDDAAGEAFDKGGKMLGLKYPAGQEIDQISIHGDRTKIKFPIGLIKDKENLNLSFSGIKTALRVYLSKNLDLNTEQRNDIIASYQEAIIQTITTKLEIIKKEYKDLSIVVGGGVACNSRLRSVLKEQYKNVKFVAPEYCTDNAAMIANLAYRNIHNSIKYPECLTIDAKSRFIDKNQFTKKA